MTRFTLILVLGLAVILAACASPASSEIGPTEPPPQVQPTLPPAPTATLAPTLPAEPLPTAPLPTDTPPPATEAVALFNGIQQGYTADGFPYLGDPAAPVTLIDYSDFL
jgi:hypothetical protein